MFVSMTMVQWADALELIYPEDGTFVVRSDFMIVKGGAEPPLDGLTIEINGLKSGLIDISNPEYKKIFADFLILEPEFEPGKNSISLEGYAQGEVVRKVAGEIYFLKDPYGLPPSGYRPYVMHTPQREALCAPCHNMSPTPQQLQISSADQNPCGSCHKRMLDKKQVHGPAGVFRCTTCHDPNSKPSKYKTSGGNEESCAKCHTDKVASFKTARFVHGPVAVGLCSVCHDSHASDHPAQMHGPINDVCSSCHANVDLNRHVVSGIMRPHPLQGVADPSRPGRELSCSSCHNPHSGASKVFFEEKYAASTMMLCQKCHNK